MRWFQGVSHRKRPGYGFRQSWLQLLLVATYRSVMCCLCIMLVTMCNVGSLLGHAQGKALGVSWIKLVGHW